MNPATIHRLSFIAFRPWQIHLRLLFHPADASGGRRWFAPGSRVQYRPTGKGIPNFTRRSMAQHEAATLGTVIPAPTLAKTL